MIHRGLIHEFFRSILHSYKCISISKNSTLFIIFLVNNAGFSSPTAGFLKTLIMHFQESTRSKKMLFYFLCSIAEFLLCKNSLSSETGSKDSEAISKRKSDGHHDPRWLST
jgi:hypothetical protein